MQYALTLPADYDMGIVRHRVATRGGAFDGFAGLTFKAFLIRERGVAGSPVNEYAPFYVWHDPAGMGRFLWGGGGFSGIVDDFGRPAVRHWTGVTTIDGPARAETPRRASRHTVTIPAGDDPRSHVATAREALEEIAREADVHTAALAVDPTRWEIVRVVLRTSDHPEAQFEVLHVSREVVSPNSREVRC